MDGCVGMQMGGEGGGFSDVQGLGWEGKSWGGGWGKVHDLKKVMIMYGFQIHFLLVRKEEGLIFLSVFFFSYF